MVTFPTRERLSLGASTSWYAAWPATVTLLCVVTSVLGPTAASTCLAACCGVSGACGTAGLPKSPSPLTWGGIRILVAEFVLLCQSHAVVPFLMKSVSPICTGAASRICLGPPYQIFRVWDPASKEVMEVGLAAPGSCGMPSDAVSTTVPVSGGGALRLASAASNCAGVRAGSFGAACAIVTADAVATAATAATAPAGTAHRARREGAGNPNIEEPRS